MALQLRAYYKALLLLNLKLKPKLKAKKKKQKISREIKGFFFLIGWNFVKKDHYNQCNYCLMYYCLHMKKSSQYKSQPKISRHKEIVIGEISRNNLFWQTSL